MRLALLTALVLSGVAQATSLTPEGTFSCEIRYSETLEVVIDDGADFPHPGRPLNPPRTRVENLQLHFFSEPSEAKVLILNAAQSLPSWLFVKPGNQAKQSSMLYATNHYVVHWPRTWYFGSTVELKIKAGSEKTLKLDVLFDDNDGWTQTLDNVSCEKI